MEVNISQSWFSSSLGSPLPLAFVSVLDKF
jgi:hypothetical protein